MTPKYDSMTEEQVEAVNPELYDYHQRKWHERVHMADEQTAWLMLCYNKVHADLEVVTTERDASRQVVSSQKLELSNVECKVIRLEEMLATRTTERDALHYTLSQVRKVVCG